MDLCSLWPYVFSTVDCQWFKDPGSIQKYYPTGNIQSDYMTHSGKEIKKGLEVFNDDELTKKAECKSQVNKTWISPCRTFCKFICKFCKFICKSFLRLSPSWNSHSKK